MNSVEQTFDVDGPAEVSIRQAAGSVKVVSGPPGRVQVSIVGGGAGKVPLAQYGNRIEIGIDGKLRGNYRTVLTLPTGTELTAGLASANLSVAVELGGLTVKSASSDVEADAVTGDVLVKIASGDVRIGRVGGRARIASASGDLEIGEALGPCVAHTASGDVEIDFAGGDVEAKTASGEVVIRRFMGGSAAAKSMSGDVEVGVPSGTRVELNLSTLSGKVELPEESGTTQDSIPERRVAITAKSVSGDITIVRTS